MFSILILYFKLEFSFSSWLFIIALPHLFWVRLVLDSSIVRLWRSTLRMTNIDVMLRRASLPYLTKHLALFFRFFNCPSMKVGAQNDKLGFIFIYMSYWTRLSWWAFEVSQPYLKRFFDRISMLVDTQNDKYRLLYIKVILNTAFLMGFWSISTLLFKILR